MIDDKALETAAMLAHEANRFYCVSIGDTTQVPWSDAPQWQKDSAINGVKQIAQDPLTTAAQSHEGWLKEKREAGWVYGEVKDADKKTHHCMVPYEQLPAEQRTKDAIFGAVVRAALHCYGQVGGPG
jgi:hypothetical protein